jgi:hypothetical protein
VSASSSNGGQAASTKPAADFLTAVKTALDAGADPGLIAMYVGKAAEQPSAGTLRLLADLLADTVKRTKAAAK